MAEDDLDPMIQKVFVSIQQFQQYLIYTAFETGLKDYLRFLLGFAIRNDEVRDSEIIHTITHQRFVNIVSETTNQIPEVPEGDMTNDMSMIPRQWGPMISLAFELVEVGKARNKKMKIISNPDYDDIRKDMFFVVRTMIESLKGIKRVETAVFPLLTL